MGMANGRGIVEPSVRTFLVHLRNKVKCWSLEEAAAHLFGVDGEASTLWRIEKGVTKAPNPETRRNLASGYGFDKWQSLCDGAQSHADAASLKGSGKKSAGTAPTEIDRVEVLTTPDLAYGRLCAVLKRVNRQPRLKVWMLGALHGVDDERWSPDTSEESPSKLEFDRLLQEFSLQKGERRWRIKMLFNVVSVDRFQRLEGLLNHVKQAVDFEIKFVMVRNSLSMLSPCIIGERDSFVGVQDPSYYRIQSVIHLFGKRPRELLRDHWEYIWNQARWLRRATAVIPATLEELRDQFTTSKPRRPNPRRI